MLFTSPRMPRILLQSTKAESACQPVKQPPAMMLMSSARNSLLSVRETDQTMQVKEQNNNRDFSSTPQEKFATHKVNKMKEPLRVFTLNTFQLIFAAFLCNS